jgi:hypothetical protein
MYFPVIMRNDFWRKIKQNQKQSHYTTTTNISFEEAAIIQIKTISIPSTFQDAKYQVTRNNLSVILYGYKTWYFTLNSGHIL